LLGVENGLPLLAYLGLHNLLLLGHVVPRLLLSEALMVTRHFKNGLPLLLEILTLRLVQGFDGLGLRVDLVKPFPEGIVFLLDFLVQ